MTRYEIVQQCYTREGLKEDVVAVVQEHDRNVALRSAFIECKEITRVVNGGIFTDRNGAPPTPFYIREVSAGPCLAWTCTR
jgi:hypothetical protein